MFAKFLVFAISVFLICVALQAVACGQTSFAFDNSTLKPKEKKESKTTIKIRNTVSNSLESDNGIPIIESTNNFLETTISIERGKNTYWGSSGIATSTDHFGSAGKFVAGFRRPMYGIELSVQGTTLLSRKYKFGDAQVEISKTFEISKGTKLRPFTNISYITPLQTGRSNIHRGVVSRTGVQLQKEFHEVDFDFKSQLWLDSGAITEGKRIGVNCEGLFLVPMPQTGGKLKVGPRLGFIYFPYLVSDNHELKSKMFNFGLTFALY